MSWVAAAIGGSAIIGGVTKAVTGNQDKQRNKGYIDANYRLATDRLNTQQRATRETNAESLAARGISPVASAMGVGNVNTLGGQTTANLEGQLGLERQDLNNQHTQALKSNEASYLNTLVGAGVGAANGVVQGLGADGDFGAARGTSIPSPSSTSSTSSTSPVQSAMMSGSTFDRNVDAAVDPLGHPSSPWYQGSKTLNATPNTSNADFNVG